MAPWKVMWQGPAPTARTVLLDYLSPMNIVALFTSIEASDLLVALAIVASLLIKLLTIVSTGLFALRELTAVSDPQASLNLSNKFGVSNSDVTQDVMLIVRYDSVVARPERKKSIIRPYP